MKRLSLFCLFCVVLFSLSQLSFAATPVTETVVQESPVIPDLLGEEEERSDGWPGDSFAQEIVISDPLEPVNRVFFTMNDTLYDWVLKPVSDGYTWLLPYELRSSFGNLFANLGAPIRFVNALLQGDVAKSWIVLKRFAINSTAGVLGMTDVAMLDFDLLPQRADFGQTLGKWGVGFGPYIYWPFLGPSSLRDTVGMGVDHCLHPVDYYDLDWKGDAAFHFVQGVNTLSLNPDMYEDLRRITFDPYVAVKQAYYDYRIQLIRDAQDRTR